MGHHGEQPGHDEDPRPEPGRLGHHGVERVQQALHGDRLSDELRQQIFAKAKELGYCGPSAAGRALRSGKSGICGFVSISAWRRSPTPTR